MVAIMSLIAAAAGIGAYRAFRDSQVKTATMGARTIRGAIKSAWVMTGKSDCPTVSELVADHLLDEDSPRKDPWGQPWRVECSGDEASVGSDGPDAKRGTEDDIRIPPLHRGSGSAAPEDSS